MSEYIIEIPDEYFASYDEKRDMYYPDERDSAMPITPIVRCRDCTGLVETWDGWECERFSGEYHRAEPDGFCSWSCRRSDKE